MPEQPEQKAYRRRVEPGAVRRGIAQPRYAELHCATNFSFLRGASHPDELVQRAAELGYHALAITDRHSLAGVVRAHTAAKAVGLKLLIGAEILPRDGVPLVLWATNRSAYGNLADLLSRGKLRAPKGKCYLSISDVAECNEGLLAGVILASHIWDDAPQISDPDAILRSYRDIFGDRCYALLALHRGGNDETQLRNMLATARRFRIPPVASNAVLYHDRRRQFLHHVLTAIRLGCTVGELDYRRFPNAERHLKAPDQMRYLFAACPEAVARTLEIADRCTFSLDELRYEYPRELCPEGFTPLEYLKYLTWQGAKRRYPHGMPQKVKQLCEHELQLIEELHYEAYFLTVWDLVRFARERGILCQGRGSAANSAVCYCLGVTSVDPDRIDVLFERFVSKERDEAPDIDIDFEHERREEVLQYIYDKYGRDRAGMTAEVITYRIRSAVREVSKALGLSLDQVDALAKAQEHFFEDEKLAERFHEAGLDPRSRTGKQLAWLVRELLGFPRHLSQHVGGMVITQGPLRRLVPIENAAMPGRTVVEWDKDDLDALGILKVDCLGLGMLTAIRKAFAMIERHEGKRWTLATVPAEDPKVYAMIQKADTMGVFQIESRAQMSMLPRLKPKCFYDLVIEVAIVRPGPIQGDMVHPYLRRRSGAEPVTYPDERVREVLHKTLGVPLFQEQAMRLAVVAAGFTPGEADQLRRAMGAWRKRGLMERFEKKLIDGMLANGYDRRFAEQVFRQIRGFGEYGFPESHAASFALLVYVSAWLKCHYPAVFAASILNSQPMGFYQPAQLVADARKHGVEIRPVDVNFSEWDCTLEPATSTPSAWALRLGLRLVRGLSASHADRIASVRGDKPFRSFDDFSRRTRLPRNAILQLAEADAFASLHLDRRRSLWQALDCHEPLPLFEDTDDQEPEVALPSMAAHEEVLCDYHTVGLSLKGHPLQFLRKELEKLKIVCARDLDKIDNDHWVRVAGIVLMRQRPSTAKGITFVTLEDETGQANLIIRPDIWERYHTAARTAVMLLAEGRLQKEGQIIHILVQRLYDLSHKLAGRPLRSRDFR